MGRSSDESSLRRIPGCERQRGRNGQMQVGMAIKLMALRVTDLELMGYSQGPHKLVREVRLAARVAHLTVRQP